MPEGPEIRQAADALAKVLRGRVADRIELLLPGLSRLAARLEGRRIADVEPRSKAMLIHFEGGYSLYSHNQLYGRWMVVRAGRMPKTQRSLRVALHMRDHSALLYSASDIAILSRAQLQKHPYLCRLGPDLLDPGTTAVRLRAHAAQPRFRRRRLAALLLDQGFFAGLGNYLRSEILFLASLSPQMTLGELDPTELTRLADTALSLTRQAYRCRGVTNDLERSARLKSAGLHYNEYRHHVFARAGLPCWTCETPIERVEFSARAVFVCPVCQASPTA